MTDEPKTETKGVPAEIRNEIATAENDVTLATSLFLLKPQDALLAQRGGARGVGIYQDLLRDGHVKGVLRKRMRAVIAREYEWESGGERPIDVEAMELCQAAVKRVRFDQACLALLGALVTNFAVVEILWHADQVDGRWYVLPQALKYKNPRRFAFDAGTNLRLLTPEDRIRGIELPPRKFVVARAGEEETEDPYGLGLGQTLFWYVYFKRQGLAFWLQFAERFGEPTKHAGYEPGTGEAEQQKILNALRSLARDGNIVLPKTVELKLLEAQRTGSIDTYAKLVAFCNAEISKAVLGETLTTELGDTGARAASETHNDVREELTDGDADLLAPVLREQLFRHIVELNLPGAEIPTLWFRQPDEQDLKARVEIDHTLWTMGFDPELDYVVETYGGRWSKRSAPSPGQGSAAPGMPRGTESAFAERETETPEILVDKLDAASADAIEAMLSRIRDAIQESASFAEAEARLLEIFPSLPSEELGKVLEQAFLVAHLAGRQEVKDGG